VFDIEESRRILTAAKELGFKIRMHADEIVPLGGAELAAKLDAISADHLMQISDRGIRDMVRSGTVFTMLPGTTFFLMSDRYAPAKKIIDAGGTLALSTDLYPGSSHTHSMPLMINLACLRMGMTIEQAVNAATINGAHALEISDRTGSLHPGKQADLIFLDAPNYEFLVYNFGVNRVNGLMKKGQMLF
jgi:imidazolonepropionase